MKKESQRGKILPMPPGGDLAGLPADLARWVGEVQREWDLEEHHRLLLIGAAVQLGRARKARETLDAEGLVYLDRWRQPRERPEVAVERQALAEFRRTLRELGLDLPPPADSRPPRIGGG